MIKILLPVDGSPEALAAVRYALHLVDEGLRAEFLLANVQEPATLYDVVVAHDVEVIDQVRRTVGAELLASAEYLLDEAGLSWESEVAGGEPSHVLVEMIERYACDAVVMGSSGAGSLRSALVGSVTDRLLQHSPVPVTVVRLPEDAGTEALGESPA